MEANNIMEDPFINSEADGEMEPLHAADAARRLLNDGSATEELEAAPFAVLGGTADEESMAPVLGGNTNSGNFDVNGSRSALTNSLFERIQQQKNQQSSSMQPLEKNPATNTEAPFGYPMTEDANYSFAEQPSTQESQVQMQVPQYSSAPRPDPYATGGTDYKSKMIDVLSSVGSVASIAARGAVSGTKSLYGNIMSDSGTRSGVGSNSSGKMNEMDYQRRSLLMDPHDLEERAVPVSVSPPSSSPIPTGMIGGLDQGSNTDVVRGQGYTMVGYAQQFMVDVKDLFLAAPRYVQGLVIGLFVLISWLLFF